MAAQNLWLQFVFHLIHLFFIVINLNHFKFQVKVDHFNPNFDFAYHCFKTQAFRVVFHLIQTTLNCFIFLSLHQSFLTDCPCCSISYFQDIIDLVILIHS